MELDPKLSRITQELAEHYSTTFRTHGATPQGVDWGREEDVLLRYAKMLEVIPAAEKSQRVSLLDVGCGYGGLLEYAQKNGYQIDYTGIDASAELIEEAARRAPTACWIHSDVLSLSNQVYDYVVCNGILTQKLQTSHLEMDRYAEKLIQKLFALSERGAAFNVMSTFVNYQRDNLYHRSPTEMLCFCLSQITRKVRLDHAYPLYEYTVYLYQP
ncbi:class I SAM-dependent methyltransferase [bacterium]|nr:class I SAM-dependent methyltransferase [bacterium]